MWQSVLSLPRDKGKVSRRSERSSAVVRNCHKYKLIGLQYESPRARHIPIAKGYGLPRVQFIGCERLKGPRPKYQILGSGWVLCVAGFCMIMLHENIRRIISRETTISTEKGFAY